MFCLVKEVIGITASNRCPELADGMVECSYYCHGFISCTLHLQNVDVANPLVA